MKQIVIPILIGLASSLGACRDEGPAERAGQAIDEAVEDAGEAVDDAGEAIEDKADEAREKARKALE